MKRRANVISESVINALIMSQVMLMTSAVGYTQGAEEGQGAPPQQQAPPAPPPPNMEAIRQLRERFEKEPTVKEVQMAALKFFRVHPKVVDGYRSGAEWKAWVPEVEVSANTERGDNIRNMIDALYQERFPDFKEKETAKRSGFSMGVRVHWYLDRLVFNAEVLDVTSLVGVQEGLIREITSLFFTRRRLMTIFALNPPQDPGEQITESIRLDEITANLDALTGGYLSSEIKRRFDQEEDDQE